MYNLKFGKIAWVGSGMYSLENIVVFNLPLHWPF